MSESLVRVGDVLTYLDEIAPVELRLERDNVGHLVGRRDRRVERVLIALDITEEVIAEARGIGAQLIVSHHPLIFAPLYHVTDADLTGRKILGLAQNDMAAICMHTNLDVAAGGVNDALAEILGLTDVSVLCPAGEAGNGAVYGLGRVGMLPAPVPMAAFLRKTKESLHVEGLRYYDAGVPVHKVGLLGGSGSGELSQAIKAGCDTYVTGDVKYHTFLEARELGVNLIDGDHYCTENIICPRLRDQIAARFPELDVRLSERHGQTVRFF